MTISWVVLIYVNKARKTSGHKKEMPDVFFFTEKWVNFALLKTIQPSQGVKELWSQGVRTFV